MSDLIYITLKLEARGYRVTPSRRAVIALALAQTGHFTVDDLVTHCRGAGRATVFRTIRLLTEIGVVCRVLFGDGSTRYMVSWRGHHHHVVCTGCGAVQDLDQCAIKDAIRNEDILSIAITRVGPFPPRMSNVGVVIDLAVHDIDLIRWFTESDIVEVQPQLSSAVAEREDIALLQFRTASGVLALCALAIGARLLLRRRERR